MLRKRANEILDLVDKAVGELTAAEDSIAGDIYIGAGETEGVHFLTRTARRLQEQYPLIHFHVSSGDTVDVMEQLDKGLIDLGLVFSHLDEKKYSSIALPACDTMGHYYAERRSTGRKRICDRSRYGGQALDRQPEFS